MALALLVLAGMAWLWPLPLAPASTLLVEPDPFLASGHEVWLAWLLRATPWDQLTALHTRLVLPPAGLDLRYYHEWLTAGIGALISVPAEALGLEQVRALTLGVNLANLCALVLSGVAVQRTARALGASRVGEALAVGALLCSPVLRSMVALANPEQLWVGLVLLAAHEVVLGQGSPVARGLRAALWGLLAGLATRYLFLATAGSLAALLVGALFLSRRGRPIASAAGVALALMVPIGVFLGWPQLTAPEGASVLELARPVYPHPIDLFVPSIVYTEMLDPAVENHAYSAYIGLTLLGLAGLGAVRGTHRERLLFGAGAGLLLAGMGWETRDGLPLPLTAVAAVVPVIDNLHAPHRFVLSGQVLLAALVGLRATGQLRWLVGAGLVLEGLVAARGLVPFPAAPLPPPPPLLSGPAAPIEGALAEITFDEALRGSHHMEMHSQHRQMHHGRPLLQMPSWPGGGVEPTIPGLDRTVRQRAADAVLALDPGAPGQILLPQPSYLDEAVRGGLRWLVVLLPPEQALLRRCELRSEARVPGASGEPGEPGEPGGLLIDCSAPSPAE